MRNSLRRYINPRNRDPIPAMTLLFARDKALDPMVDFTRASENASYYSAAGVLSYAALNEPRFTHDPSTLQSLGLLIEESRTNLLTYSEEFDNAAWTKSNVSVTQNAFSAPDGTSSGDRLGSSTPDLGTRFAWMPFATSSGTSYSLSCFMKRAPSSNTDWGAIGIVDGNGTSLIYATFNLSSGAIGVGSSSGSLTLLSKSMENVGNGWYRCSLSVTSTSSGASASARILAASGTSSVSTIQGDDVAVWGAQLEAGSFPTSYIKTTSSTATRAADSASITGANFSSWYNQAEGTFVVKSKNPPSGNLHYSAYVSDGSANNSIRIGQSVSGYSDFTVASSSVVQASFQTISVAGQESKTAGSYRADNFAQSVNGGAVSIDSSGAVPVVDRMHIGSRHGSGNWLNGTIASIAYYPTRLSNSYLQYLTS